MIQFLWLYWYFDRLVDRAIDMQVFPSLLVFPPFSFDVPFQRAELMGCGTSTEVRVHQANSDAVRDGFDGVEGRGSRSEDSCSESSKTEEPESTSGQRPRLDPVVIAFQEILENPPSPSPHQQSSSILSTRDSQEEALADGSQTSRNTCCGSSTGSPTTSPTMPSWIVPSKPLVGITQPGHPALSSNPNSVSAFSLESAHSSGNEPIAGPATPSSSARQSARDAAAKSENLDVGFSSSSVFVPKDASFLKELRKRFQGGYRDVETGTFFSTRAQRYEILCAEVVGKAQPPTGNGLLFTHPNIYHGAPFPLEAFADSVAWTKELKGTQRQTCCDFLVDLPGFVHLALARPTGAGEADLIRRSMARAQTYGLVKLQVILLELYTQMKDLQVLDAMPDRVIAAVKQDDIAELQKTYQERLGSTDSGGSPTTATSRQGFTQFLKREIFQNIHYCAMLGRYHAQKVLTELESTP